MVFFMSEISFESFTLIFHCFSCCILHAKLSLHFVTLSFFRKFDAHILNLLLCILLAETIQLAEAIVILRVRSLTIVSLSKGVFERRTSTGSEDFSLLICLDDIKFALLSFFTIIVTIRMKIWAKQSFKNKKRATSGWRASLKNVVA